MELGFGWGISEYFEISNMLLSWFSVFRFWIDDIPNSSVIFMYVALATYNPVSEKTFTRSTWINSHFLRLPFYLHSSFTSVKFSCGNMIPKSLPRCLQVYPFLGMQSAYFDMVHPTIQD